MATDRPLTVLGIAGSLRRASFNRGLIRAAVEVAPPGIRLLTHEIGDVPLYNGDVEAEGDPAPVTYADYRIDVDAPIDQERRGSTVVPAGVEFNLTDVVLQNPHGDRGLATLLRDDAVLYEWDLGQMNSANEFQPRISPLSFQPGENLVLRVDCEASGRSDGTGCEVSVLLTGALIPLD